MPRVYLVWMSTYCKKWTICSITKQESVTNKHKYNLQYVDAIHTSNWQEKKTRNTSVYQHIESQFQSCRSI